MCIFYKEKVFPNTKKGLCWNSSVVSIACFHHTNTHAHTTASGMGCGWGPLWRPLQSGFHAQWCLCMWSLSDGQVNRGALRSASATPPPSCTHSHRQAGPDISGYSDLSAWCVASQYRDRDA